MLVGVGRHDVFLAGSGWVCDLFLLGVSERDLFLARSEWMWLSVTYFWPGMGGCGCVWVSARFT